MTQAPDPILDTLLDLDGQVLVVDPEGGHWVRFVVTRVPASSQKPHGLDYSLTLHGPDGERLVGFDNAHRIGRQRRGEPHDHAIGSERSRPTTTGTRRPCSPISGPQWTRCCAREE